MKSWFQHLIPIGAVLLLETWAVATDGVVSSRTPNDSGLILQGYEMFASTPAAAWTNGTTIDQPHSRYGHSTVWTGTEMIVWGGNIDPGVYATTGGRYSVANDQWTTVSTILAPPGRTDHVAVWTGTEMLIWGGFNASGFQDTGGRYLPGLQQWRSLSTQNAPTGRREHVAIWNGSRLVVFGGRDGTGYLNDGGVYDPAADTWGNLNTNNAPAARGNATAIWTESQMVVWGGHGQAGELNTGGRFTMDSQGRPLTWQTLSTVGAPTAREDHIAVWTGSRMLVWGGKRSGIPLGDGASYDPSTDSWTPISSTNAPSARNVHTGIWSGTELLIWGGEGADGTLADGAAYNPVSDTWRNLTTGGSPIARSGAGAIWSGSELVVFGGQSGGNAVAALQRLNPTPPWYLYRVATTNNSRPVLEIAKNGPGISLSWPLAGSAGFVAERSINTGPADVWTPIATQPATVNDRKVITLIPVSRVHFFRLRRP